MRRIETTQPIEITPEFAAWCELIRARRASRDSWRDVALDDVLAEYLSSRSVQ